MMRTRVLNMKLNKSEIEYLLHIIQELKNPYSQYYTKGYVNSEGKTLIFILSRIVLKYFPFLKNVVKELYKCRDFECISSRLEVLKTYIQSFRSEL